MDYNSTLISLSRFLFLQASTIIGLSDVKYGNLGTFSMSPPWFTTIRPLPPPQTPDVIATAFSRYTRAQPTPYDVTKLPDISLTGSDFSGLKPTFFITHGFASSGNVTWITDIASALLNRFDANVIVVDWSKGAGELNYLQVASNIRVVAAEIIRLCKYLINSQASSPSRWHLIGHSLGAHAFSYVAKALPGVARLTALDPAAPAFEGFPKQVRLDVTDAVFVEVIHTDALPLIPFLGLGMSAAHGHVDYYMNGGFRQPGCLSVQSAPSIASFFDLAYVMVEDIADIVSCPHGRSHDYFLESLVNAGCLFWGQTSLTPMSCNASNCSPMGLESINYPARGQFQVRTNPFSPFCLADVTDTNIMMQYRSQRNIVAN